MSDHAALLLTSYETATFGNSFFGGVEQAPGLVAESLGNSVIAQEWSDLMKGLHDLTPELLATFVRCRETAPDPQHPALIELVRGHETILAFTELELAGHSDVSLAALTRYLETVR